MGAGALFRCRLLHTSNTIKVVYKGQALIRSAGHVAENPSAAIIIILLLGAAALTAFYSWISAVEKELTNKPFW